MTRAGSRPHEPTPVSVVIPAFNEAVRIEATVAAARCLPGAAEVIVVDDGSADDTAQVAARAGASRVVRHARNRGKARAMESGADAASGRGLLLFLDADLGPTAAEAGALLRPVQAGEADMSVAAFPVVPGRGGGRGIVVRLARWGIRAATGRTVAAPLSGQRCLTLEAFARARPLAAGFGVETALTIDVLRAGLRVVEVPTTMDHRVTGDDWAARRHRARQLRDVVRALAPRLLLRGVAGRPAAPPRR
jgi:glycosyltransferase involved in cell wall biosynthesis